MLQARLALLAEEDLLLQAMAHACVLFAEKVGRIGHITDRVEKFDSVRAVGHDEGPVGMTVADDLEIKVVFGLAMAVAGMERHGEIRTGATISDHW